MTYDKNLRTTKVDAPDSKQSRTYYDRGSRSLPASDITSETLVPQSGRVTSRRDYLVADSTYVSVAFDYDNNSQVTATTDQNGNVWTKTYDAMGRHRTTVTPTVSSTSYTNTKWYDGNGNVVKVTDFNSHDTEYVYNQMNQRTRIRYKGAGGGGSDVDILYRSAPARRRFVLGRLACRLQERKRASARKSGSKLPHSDTAAVDRHRGSIANTTR